jgi:hypothetical protein
MTGKVHHPDRRTRELVSALALNGVAQSRVALHVGISEPSLRKHYRQELDLATESVCARVAKNLVRIDSTGSGNAAVQAAKDVLGAKGGWKDVGRLEVEPSSRSSLTGLNRVSSVRTCAFRTEFRIVVIAFRIVAKARSSGLRENPRIATTSFKAMRTARSSSLPRSDAPVI